jgi:NCAIR mutase (PurE)-related protein
VSAANRLKVIRAAGRSPREIVDLVRSVKAHDGPIFVAQASEEHYKSILDVIPTAVRDERSGMIVVRPFNRPRAHNSDRRLAVLAAGTSDLPVAEEAAFAAEAMGHPVLRIYDVGVAGIHRLLAARSDVDAASCVIAVAGMEGALPSVVAGLVSKPVIAVPTSIGYGASLGGAAALLAMMEATSRGFAVVGIDDGVAAAVLANRILSVD